MSLRKDQTRTIKYFDYTLLFLVIFLIGMGLVMLYSVSAYECEMMYGDPTYYLVHQAKCVAIGLVGMIIMIIYPYDKLRWTSIAFYIISLGLCAAVLLIGKDANGSYRAIKLPGFSLQPSELAKLAIILLVAYVLSTRPKTAAKIFRLKGTLFAVILICGLVAIENLSTAVIMFGIAFIMLFVVSPKYKDFGAIIVVGLLFVAAFVKFAGYRATRIYAWLDPDSYPDDAYQTFQGLYAIGSGGLFGKGLGGSYQKLGALPEAQNDFIFTIICEELGLFGAICVIILFILVIWRLMVIAINASTLFGSMIVVGILSHIALQVIFNVGVVTGLLPNTGITLPFFSYGGTAIIMTMAEMGLALNVSRSIQFDSKHPEE